MTDKNPKPKRANINGFSDEETPKRIELMEKMLHLVIGEHFL